MAKLAWVTGAGGFIGSNLVAAASTFAPGFRVQPITRQRLELTDFLAVRKAFMEEKPDLLIHCAALSRSLACQQNPALARRLNVEVTQFLAGLAEAIPFIFYSTDLVFDGRKGHYLETDPVGPLSVYAETKVAAEQIVLANPRHTVLRTSLTYGFSPSGQRSFNEEMMLAWQAGRTVKLFTDEFRCPIAAPVTAQAVWEFVNKGCGGLYHLAGSERLSRWQIGQLVARQAASGQALIVPALLREYEGPPRPPDTSLNCEKIQKLLSCRLMGLSEWLARKRL